MTNRTDSTTAATGTRAETGSEAAATSEDAYSESGTSPPPRDDCPAPLFAKREEALEHPGYVASADKLAHPAPNNIRLFEIAETKMPGNDAGQMHEGDAFCDGGSSPPRAADHAASPSAERDGSVEPTGDDAEVAPATTLATTQPSLHLEEWLTSHQGVPNIVGQPHLAERLYLIEAVHQDDAESLIWRGFDVPDWLWKSSVGSLRQYALSLDAVREQYADAVHDDEGRLDELENATIRVRVFGSRKVIHQEPYSDAIDPRPFGLASTEAKEWHAAIAALQARLRGELEPNIEKKLTLGSLHTWLRYGEFHDTTNMRVQNGAPRECHANAAKAAEEHPFLQVIYGLARGEDSNVWVVHSWCRDARDGTLVEVTAPHYDLYFAWACNDGDGGEV